MVDAEPKREQLIRRSVKALGQGELASDFFAFLPAR
jgi:hypothetical protein